jgi:ribonuclease III
MILIITTDCPIISFLPTFGFARWQWHPQPNLSIVTDQVAQYFANRLCNRLCLCFSGGGGVYSSGIFVLMQNLCRPCWSLFRRAAFVSPSQAMTIRASSVFARKSPNSAASQCPGHELRLTCLSSRLLSSDTQQQEPVLRKPIDVSRRSVAELEHKLLHRFSDKGTLVRAMIHKSCSMHPIRMEMDSGDWLNFDGIGNNERCEWLGDRVFGLYVAQFLYSLEPEKSEGELSKLAHALVSRTHANVLSIKLGLPEHLVSSPEYNLAGPEAVPTPSRFGDFLECCFAALFADGGDAAVRNFFDGRVAPLLEETLQSASGIPRNYRGELQEMLLRNGFVNAGFGTQLQYRDMVLDAESENNDVPTMFYQSICLYDVQVAVGVGQTKAKAAQEASRMLLERFKNEDITSFLRNLASRP